MYAELALNQLPPRSLTRSMGYLLEGVLKGLRGPPIVAEPPKGLRVGEFPVHQFPTLTGALAAEDEPPAPGNVEPLERAVPFPQTPDAATARGVIPATVLEGYVLHWA